MIGRQTLLWRLAAVAALAAAPLAADDKNPPPPVQVAPTPAQPPDAPKASGTSAVAEAPLTPPVAAKAAVPSASPRRRSAADLEKLVGPIALYPDPLLASVLTASAYPLEVVQAARFVKDPNNLAKLDQQPWDENVKTVARFPEVIGKMSEELSWTVELGQAFVAQQMDVMDSVQTLRGKAQANGALRSGPEQTVTVADEVVQQASVPPVYVTNQVVQILPAQPEVVYVPQYNPAVVYSPAYVYDPWYPWYPWITFGFGIACGPWFWSDCYWHGGYVVYGGWGHYPYGWHGHWSHPYPYYSSSRVYSTYPGAGNVRSSADPRVGGTQRASRPWQADPNRLRNSFGTARPMAGTGSLSTSGARGTRPQISARPASPPGAVSAAQSGASPMLAGTRTVSGATGRPGSGAGSSQLRVPRSGAQASVGSAGVASRPSFSSPPSSRTAGRSAPSLAAVPSAQSAWRGGASAPLPARGASGATRYGSAASFPSGSTMGHAARSAPSFNSRGAGANYGGGFSRPSAGSSFGRGGGGFSAPSSGGGHVSGGGFRGGRR